MRRRLREIVNVSAAGAGQLCPGHDYVLIGRRAALAAPFGEMVKELDAALDRIAASVTGELVAPTPTAYMKRVRRPDRPAATAAP